MRLQRCSKCKESKPISDFHIDRSRASGLQRYCKPCKRGVDSNGVKGKFIVYYLPKERYIGMTKNYNRRVNKHKNNGKDVRYAFVVLKTKKMKLAHLLETMFHMLGFNGFRY